MPSQKNGLKQHRGTVESKHKEMMTQFMFDKKMELPKKKEKLEQIRTELDNIYLDDIPRRELTRKAEKLRDEIHAIENNVNEYKYMLDAGPLLFQYYQTLVNPTNLTSKRGLPPSMRKGGLLAKKNRNSSSRSRSRAISKDGVKKEDNTSDPKKKQISRFELYDEYRSITDVNYVKQSKTHDKKQESVCPNCNVLMRLNYRESVYICPDCAIECTTFIDSDRPSYKDPPPEVNYFAYKRINHFNELLAQFQAKESTHIPPEVFDMIKCELKKERKTVKDLNYELVRRYLKKHSDKKFNQYYDHISHIINRLNGEKPRNMSQEMEEKLRFLFLQIQEPFEKYCPEDRKNFISYNFVFYKFCELLGYKEFLPYFPLLKSKDKLYEQEKIWEKICLDIGLA